jgi:enoyl-[acyl-carrier-protein] reductase (NADH)
MRQITNGVLFLASDAADAVTGHVLPVTNGDL